LREFAQERLDADARGLRARHREYFLQFARRAAGKDGESFEREFANLKQALSTAIEDGAPTYAVELGTALRPHWESHGTLADELRLLERAVALCPEHDPRLHDGLDLLAQLTLIAGNGEQARIYAQRALCAAGDGPVRRARALVTSSRLIWERDQRDQGVTP